MGNGITNCYPDEVGKFISITVLSGCPPVAAFRFRGRGPRSGRCGLRSGVPRRPARRRRATRSSSWPAGWFACARRTCGPGPLRPWRFSRSRSATAGPAGPPRVAAGRTGPTSARLRPRLEERRLPVRWTCSATPCGRRASTTWSTSTTTSPPASATTGRVSTAACGSCGRATCAWSGSSTASAAIWLIWSNTVQDLSACGVGLRVLAGQGAQIDTTTATGPARVRHLRGAGRVRAGADPRTHRGRARPHGPAAARAGGSSRCRKPRCGWPRPRWRTATRRCPHLCRELGITSARRASCARAAPRRSSPPESEDRDAGRA